MPFILPTDLPEKDELPPQDDWKRSCEHSSLTCLFTPAAMHSIISHFICALLLEPQSSSNFFFHVIAITLSDVKKSTEVLSR